MTAEGKLLVRPFKPTTASVPALEDGGGLDISGDLTTFNLGLVDRNEVQREAKANVKLPYVDCAPRAASLRLWRICTHRGPGSSRLPRSCYPSQRAL